EPQPERVLPEAPSPGMEVRRAYRQGGRPLPFVPEDPFARVIAPLGLPPVSLGTAAQEDGMANLLTGDYDAVLQVSARTVNRLLASMHQNDWRNPNTPSFPHSVGIRLGDVVEVDGVRGTAWAQVGVPRVTLID